MGIDKKRGGRRVDKVKMRKVEKSFTQKLEELRQSLYRLSGAIDRYKENREIAELNTVAIELRGLLCNKEALLINLAESKGFPLELYTLSIEHRKSIDNIIKEKSYKEYIAVSLTDNLASKKNSLLSCKMNIKEWLSIPIVEIDGVKFSANRLINEIASTTGPAHYPPEISKNLLELSELKLSSGPSHFRTLLNLSEVVLDLGNNFIDSFKWNEK